MSRGLDLSAGILLGVASWASLRITAVSVGTTATAIPTTALANRKGIWVFNPSGSGQTLLVGDSTITGTNNAEIFPGASVPFPMTDGMTLYGRAAAAITVVAWEFTVT